VQIAAFEKPFRDGMVNDLPNKPVYTENALGLLPMSHIYGLVVICHSTVYRGDGVVVLPKFEFTSTLQAIQDYKINSLFLVSIFSLPSLMLSADSIKVPPIIILMTKNANLLSKYDLSSVWSLFTGAAPLGQETAEDMQKLFPSWKIRQGYGKFHHASMLCFPSNYSPFDDTFANISAMADDRKLEVPTLTDMFQASLKHVP
jgi:acyl-CoA synthetase (AMP-forming)/AMP-acid ligase II